MGKRSNGHFDRLPRDLYDTVPAAVPPLLPYLAPGTEFAEPCAGDGALIDLLTAAGHRCVWATDINPRREDIGMLNAMTLPKIGARNVRAKVIITNPPWTRSILHPLIDRLSAVWPCWLLFDADWPHTQQSADLILRCSRIVPIGRLKWIPGTKHVGKDNSAWYEFLPGHTDGPHLLPRRAPMANGHHLLMGPDERRRAEIVARGEVSEPGPLFDAAQIAPEPRPEASDIERWSAIIAKTPSPAVSPAPPGGHPSRKARSDGPNAVSLLAKLRASAGRVGPIPKLTEEAIRDDTI